MYVRRPHAHRLLYYRSPRGGPNPAPSRKRALQNRGSVRAATAPAAPRIGENSAIIRNRRRMFNGPIGRLSGRSASKRRRNCPRLVGKSGRGGIGREQILIRHLGVPVRSLPGLISAALFPVSLPIPPGLSCPFRIEMPIKSPSCAFAFLREFFFLAAGCKGWPAARTGAKGQRPTHGRAGAGLASPAGTAAGNLDGNGATIRDHFHSQAGKLQVGYPLIE